MSTKDIILKVLEENRSKGISGQDLATRLGISRSAVWKAVNSLKASGHRINSSVAYGYSLLEDSDIITEQSIETHLDKNIRDIGIHVFKSIDSTNTMAKRLSLDGAGHFTLVVSDEQTAGRGRYGKSFFSPKETGIYMSIILKPKRIIKDTQMITVYTAVCVCRVIESLTHMQPGIKWVNDIFLNGKKICGILTEAAMDFESGMVESIVVGIGINYKKPFDDFPEELSDIAGTVDFLKVSRSEIIAEIVNAMSHAVPFLFSEDHDCEVGKFKESILGEYRKRSVLTGSNVSYNLPEIGRVTGNVLGINDEGNLVVVRITGETDILFSGEVSVVPVSEPLCD